MSMKESDPHRYDDMIDLPHHVSAKHPRMSPQMRAAQFSPFAALTGYEEQVEEVVRRTAQQGDSAAKAVPDLLSMEDASNCPIRSQAERCRGAENPQGADPNCSAES